MLNPAPALTISAVADETEVSEAVLRSWEQRHGFPQPVRLPSGHRRYSADDVERIRQVVRDRNAGMSLDAAIARVMARSDRAEPSIFAGLRRRWAELPSHRLSKRAMLAISRAIEDECCAQAERPLLIGSFQRERFYRDSEARWRELARTAEATYVFADFRSNRLRRRGPTELALPDDAPLLREWAVVCDAPDAAACLAGFERPGPRDGTPRSFEAVWSVNPDVVRDAAGLGAALARRRDLTVELPERGHPATDASSMVRRATALTNRIVAYLDV
jgi:DICT domain-containing protein